MGSIIPTFQQENVLKSGRKDVREYEYFRNTRSEVGGYSSLIWLEDESLSLVQL